MLRTLFVLAIIAFGLRHAVRGPFYAVLFYCGWRISARSSWVWGGWLVQANLSFYIGVFALLWGVMSFQLRWDLRISLLVLLVFHSLGSTLASDYTTYAWPYRRGLREGDRDYLAAGIRRRYGGSPPEPRW